MKPGCYYDISVIDGSRDMAWKRKRKKKRVGSRDGPVIGWVRCKIGLGRFAGLMTGGGKMRGRDMFRVDAVLL